jgi:hypothetical protein
LSPPMCKLATACHAAARFCFLQIKVATRRWNKASAWLRLSIVRCRRHQDWRKNFQYVGKPLPCGCHCRGVPSPLSDCSVYTHTGRSCGTGSTCVNAGPGDRAAESRSVGGNTKPALDGLEEDRRPEMADVSRKRQDRTHGIERTSQQTEPRNKLTKPVQSDRY